MVVVDWTKPIQTSDGKPEELELDVWVYESSRGERWASSVSWKFPVIAKTTIKVKRGEGLE